MHFVIPQGFGPSHFSYLLLDKNIFQFPGVHGACCHTLDWIIAAYCLDQYEPHRYSTVQTVSVNLSASIHTLYDKVKRGSLFRGRERPAFSARVRL